MRQLLKNFWDDILALENIDVYTAILMALIVTLLDLFNIINFEITLPAILVTLAILTLGLLDSRRSTKRLDNVLNNLEKHKSLLKLVELPGSEFRETLRYGGKISLLGLTLFKFVPAHRVDLEHALNNGAELRLILISPGGYAIQMASFSSPSGTSAETENQHVQSTIETLRNMQNRLPNAQIQLRLIDYLPHFAITLVESKQGRSKNHCFVRIIPFRKSTLESSAIEPHPLHDEFWFEYFSSQFEDIWNAAMPKELK